MVDDEEKALVPLNTLAKTKFPLRGRTAQVENGTLWDAAQVLPILEDVKQAGAILELDLMIKTGWWGFTADNTQQAEQIAKVSDLYRCVASHCASEPRDTIRPAMRGIHCQDWEPCMAQIRCRSRLVPVWRGRKHLRGHCR